MPCLVNISDKYLLRYGGNITAGLFDSTKPLFELYYPEINRWEQVKPKFHGGSIGDITSIIAGAGGVQVNSRDVIIVGGFNNSSKTIT